MSVPRPAPWRWADLPLRAKGLAVVAISLLPLLLVSGLETMHAGQDPATPPGIWHVGAGVAGAASLLGILIFTAGVVRRVNRVAENAARLARHERLLPLPPSDDEIGRLAGHLEEAAARLAQQARERDSADTALREYAAQMLDLYDRAPCGYQSLGPDGRILAMNQTELDWLGYTGDEVVGRLRFPDLLAPHAREHFDAAFAEVQRAGTIRDVEFELIAKDGRVLPVSLSSKVVRDDQGRFVAMQASLFDISKRRAAEQALRRNEAQLSAILQTIAEGLLIISTDGEVRYWNPAAERLLGLSAEQIDGRRLDASHWQVRNASGCEIPVDQWPLHRALAHGEVSTGVEMTVVRGDGREVPLLVSGAPLRDAGGSITGAVSSFQDISDLRAAAESLRQATAIAERANDAKSEFLSRMSHDLRTPLNAMLGFAQLLATERREDAVREAVGQIRRGGEHLLALINEVLDIERIESGQISLSPEPVPVGELVQRALELVRPIADRHGVTLAAPAQAVTRTHIRADRLRMKQVLLNLLSNAVKYNRRGGRVTITAEPQSERRLRIAVADTGAGIPAEKLTLLFRPFERLGAEHTAIEGTGLGLALSKGLVEAMGGEIGIESAIDHGTTVWVEFDVADAPAAPPPAAGAPAVASAGTDLAVTGDVLYIEDNVSNVRLMQRLLARRPGVRLRSVGQGGLGIEHVKAAPPDLVLLDVHLPDLPGEEVLRRLWEDPATRDIPVAVLSADATPTQIKRLRTGGAVAYLTKPLDLLAVLGLVDHTLNRARANEGTRQE
jgi:PAS domain S-box-containing protein